MSKHDNCRECNAGLKQALQTHVGWNCAVHGPDHISVAQMINGVVELKTENDRLRDALQGILAEPYGCSLCDAGKSRNPLKGHQPDCPYEIADAVLYRKSVDAAQEQDQ